MNLKQEGKMTATTSNIIFATNIKDIQTIEEIEDALEKGNLSELARDILECRLKKLKNSRK